MANQPIFVAAYRQDYATLVAARANEAQDLFTPGADGTRLHAIALANDGEVPALVEFGAYDVVGDDVEVDIAPGSTQEEDPFTVTRAAGVWPALETGLVLTLSKGAVANRGDYRLSSRTDTVLTLENTAGNAIAAAAGIDAAIYHWRPIWSATVPARAGFDGYPAYAGLDPGQMPWLEADDGAGGTSAAERQRHRHRQRSCHPVRRRLLMANSTVTADLPRRRPPPRPHKLPASQRCIGLLNGEASYPGKGRASDITYYYMAFVMADGTVRMSGTNNNNELAMEGNAYGPQHLHYLVWDNRTNADHPVLGRPRYVAGSYSAVAMLTDDGDVVAWGHNGHGQQGRGHTTGNGIARSIDATDIGRASGIPGRDVVKLDLVRGYPTNVLPPYN